jgi:hypothetical protein
MRDSSALDAPEEEGDKEGYESGSLAGIQPQHAKHLRMQLAPFECEAKVRGQGSRVTVVIQVQLFSIA